MYMTAPGLQFFVGYSLVDITATGVIRGQNELERNQQRNWETVMQCINLRTQPLHIQGPIKYENIEIKHLHFGDFYHHQPQTFWSWSWAVESKEVYDLPNKPLGGILQDLEQVPIITGLTETAKFMLPIFYPYGSIKNVYIEEHRSA